MKKQVYGYIRVSTVRQGEGVSLEVQQDSIQEYANQHDMEVVKWFEEKQTASKRGRTQFNKLLTSLRRKQACGVIMHKVDRSARNLRDWTDLVELMDEGIEVHFSFDSIDFTTRGGRLFADMLAVISSDQTRNLSDEAKKGLNGRLKQGIYPFYAPVGYLNEGKGKAKSIDPIKAPLIQQLFEWYATGLYTILQLTEIMYQKGLRNSKGGKVTRNGVSRILNNPFYIGVIRIERTQMMYPGLHKPIISKTLFNKVQDVLYGRRHNVKLKYRYLYRKFIQCTLCNRPLTAEKQRGKIYYRCHTKGCATKTVREEVVDQVIQDMLKAISITKQQCQDMELFFNKEIEQTRSQTLNRKKALQLESSKVNSQLEILTQKLIEGVICDESYKATQQKLLFKQVEVSDSLKNLENTENKDDTFISFFERVKGLKNRYFKLNDHEKRHLLKILISNMRYSPEKLEIQLHSPYEWLFQANSAYECRLDRAHIRTIPDKEIISKTVEYNITKTQDGQFEVVQNTNTPRLDYESALLQLGTVIREQGKSCHDVMPPEDLKSAA